MQSALRRAATFARSERVAAGVFAALAVAYSVFLLTHTCEVAGGSDSSGYANEARALGHGKLTEPIPDLDRFGLDDSFTRAFCPLGYTETTRPRLMTFTYPPGLPIHMAILGVLFGWKHAPFYAIPISAIAGLLFFALFARRLFGSWWMAIAAAFTLAFSATYVFMAVQPMSDVVVTAWTVLAIAAAWRARDGRAEWAAVAGAAAGAGVWVRPSNLIMGLALLFALPWTKKALAYCVTSGAIVMAPLFVFNKVLFGSMLRTGYGAVGGLMGLDNPRTHIWHYIYWTGVLLTPFALIGAVYSLVRARRERIHLVLALWWWPFYIFYIFFGPYETWWYTRFLLPAYPALVLGMFYAVRALHRYTVPVVFAMALVIDVWAIRHWVLLEFHESEKIYPNAVRWAEAEIPPDAIVIGMQFTGARKYYKNRCSLRYEWLTPENVKVLEQKVPFDKWYAVVGDYEIEETLRKAGGRWTDLGQYREVHLLHRDPNGALTSHE